MRTGTTLKGTVIFVAGLALMSGTALAGTLQDVINNLKAEGFTVTEVDRTMLGSFKIEATNGSVKRELVYSPLFDSVLRDRTDDNGGQHQSSQTASSGSHNDDSVDDHGNDGSGHDSNDDNSGSSGDNSGSGGSDDSGSDDSGSDD
jgi:hypothetical protein